MQFTKMYFEEVVNLIPALLDAAAEKEINHGDILSFINTEMWKS